VIRIEDCHNVTDVARFSLGNDNYAIVIAVDPADSTTFHVFPLMNDKPFLIDGCRVASTVGLETQQDMQVVLGMSAVHEVARATKELIEAAGNG
jgi:hypothetical protein